MKYRVNGCSISFNGKYYTDPDILDCSQINATVVRNWLKAGKLVTLGYEDTEETQPMSKVQNPGKWNLNPADLEGKELEELNLMISERSPNMHPFDTVEEAIAQLSLSWQ